MVTEKEKRKATKAAKKFEDMYKLFGVFCRYEILPNIEKDLTKQLKDENEQLKEHVKAIREELKDLYKSNRRETQAHNNYIHYTNNYIMLLKTRELELEKQLREVVKK